MPWLLLVLTAGLVLTRLPHQRMSSHFIVLVSMKMFICVDERHIGTHKILTRLFNLFYLSLRIFDNVYIGWGNKYTGSCYNPPAPPPAFQEYPEAEEMRELDDPTVEEERALKEREEEALRAAEEIENLEEDDDDDDDE